MSTPMKPLEAYRGVLVSLRREQKIRSGEDEITAGLAAAISRVTGAAVQISYDQRAERSGDPVNQAAFEQALSAAEQVYADTRSAIDLDARRPFADRRKWPDETVERGVASWQRMTGNAISYAIGKVRIPDSRTDGVVNFDDVTCPEGAFLAQLTGAAGSFIDEKWWVTRHDDLGQSPLSALCVGQFEAVRDAARREAARALAHLIR